jgi:hypothetical protein
MPLATPSLSTGAQTKWYESSAMENDRTKLSIQAAIVAFAGGPHVNQMPMKILADDAGQGI